ncbi:MAG: hypothetical protein QW734_09395 [Candidatus Bathyarchaeia archaeon]
MSVRIEKRVEKSIARLKAMGLKVHIMEENPNSALIFVSIPSIVRYVEKQITYPNKSVYVEGDYLIIRVWRT